MSDIPMLFSGPMVRALLDGRKTQTRRVMKPQPELLMSGLYHVFGAGGGVVGIKEEDIPTEALDYVRFAPGDRLWVKETLAEQEAPSGTKFMGYAADGRHIDHTPAGWPFKRKSIPSIHMWRWASRLTLHVTEVRVQRLQDISDKGPSNDCTDEGVFLSGMPVPSYEEWHGGGFSSSEKCMYRQLWEAINGPGSWDANPWIVAITFTVEHANIERARTALQEVQK